MRTGEIGSGIPKICVPLMSGTLDRLLLEAEELAHSPADIAEFRADCFSGGSIDALKPLKSALRDIPLLFTFRTAPEGGTREISAGEYTGLCLAAARSGMIDLLDIELSANEKNCREIIAAAHENNVITVLSKHHFDRTPPKPEMLATLHMAVKLGGDIPKLAVMPQSAADVLELLAVTEEFYRENPRLPIITIAMGEAGKISRVAGGFFGSAVTFASVGQVSAPGQLNARDARTILEILHET